MRNTLAFVAALAVTVAVVGWYLGWYQVGITPAGAGHQKVNIDINTEKVTKDVMRGEQEVLEEGREKLKELTDKSETKPTTDVTAEGPPPLPRIVFEQEETPPAQVPAPKPPH
jgi:UDP-N-acetyl-D-mannosaminuronate dehydrogenase